MTNFFIFTNISKKQFINFTISAGAQVLKRVIGMKHNLLLFLVICSFSLRSQNFHWAKNAGGTSYNVGRSVAVDVTGNVYATGYFSGTSDFDPGPGVFTLTSSGNNDVFISKFNAAGNFIWAKSMGGISNDQAFSIAVDLQGNVYTTGWFYGQADFNPGAGIFNLNPTDTFNYDVFISKLDSAGNFVWAINVGGGSGDRAFSITTDAAGNIYATGSFIGAADFDTGAAQYILTSFGIEDIFVLKLNNAGNFIWAKNMGGVSLDVGYCVAVDAAFNVYISGEFQGSADLDPGPGIYNLSSAGNIDIFITKLNSSGDLIWTKSVGGPSANQLGSMALDAAGNIYYTGYFNGTVDFNPGPVTFNFTSFGGWDIFISKLDASGNFVYAKQLGGTSNDTGRSIAIDALCNVYTTGYFQGTADLDPGAAIFNLNTAGSTDMFISKINSSGNFVWAKQISGTANIYGISIAVNGGNVYNTGYFAGAIDFDPGPGNYLISSVGSADFFVCKLSCIAPTITSISSQSLICRSQTATLSANGADFYSWCTGAINSVIVVSPSITTNYSVTGIDSTGCINKSVLSVSVNACVGFKKLIPQNFELNIFPNPANDILQIQINSFEEDDIRKVFIYDRTGRLIREEEIIFDNNIAKIKIQDLLNGIYILKMSAIYPDKKDLQATIYKFVISK